MAAWILEAALQVLDLRSGGGWTLLDAPAIALAERLDGELRAGRISGADLVDLLKLVVALDADSNSRPTSRELVRILKSQPEVRAAVAARAQSLEAAALQFHERFSSETGARRAPHLGETPPEGAISGRELLQRIGRTTMRGGR